MICVVMNDRPGVPRADGVIPSVLGFRGVYESIELFENQIRKIYPDAYWDDALITFGGFSCEGRVFCTPEASPLYYGMVPTGRLNTNCYMDYNTGPDLASEPSDKVPGWE